MNHAKPLEGCPPAEAVKAFVDGELEARERELVGAHVAECTACESEAETLRMLASELRTLEGVLEPPAELRGRILSELTFRPERPARRFTIFDLARWGALGATAAVLVTIVGGITFPVFSRAREAARRPQPAGRFGEAGTSAPAGQEMEQAKQKQYSDFMRSASPPSEAGGGGGRAAGKGVADGPPVVNTVPAAPAPWGPRMFGAPRPPSADDGAGAQFADGHFKANAKTWDDGPAPDAAGRTRQERLERLDGGRMNGDAYMARSTRRAVVPQVGVMGVDAADYQYRPGGSTVTPEDVKKYTQGKEADEVRRKVVQNGTLSVRVSRKLETVQDEVSQRVKKDGGYVEASDLTAPAKGDRTSSMTLRVPVEKFEATIAWLSGLGEMQAKNLSGQDITGAWIDQRAEVRKLRSREDQLSEKIRTAKKQWERDQARWALQNLRPQISQAEEQFAYTGKLAALASISLTLTEEPQARVRGNLLHDLDGTTRAAVAAFMVAIRVPAAILIWLAIFSPLWLPCVLVYRWASRKSVAAREIR